MHMRAMRACVVRPDRQEPRQIDVSDAHRLLEVQIRLLEPPAPNPRQTCTENGSKIAPIRKNGPIRTV
jgi:hypothetical protein